MSKTVATLTADIDYVQGHLRYGHFEANLNAEELKEYNALDNDEDRIEYIREVGELVIDDYSMEDYGDVKVPELTTVKKLDYKGRLITERDELVLKHDKLVEFIEGNTIFNVLPEFEQTDLQDQADYMEAYISVLNRRIERF